MKITQTTAWRVDYETGECESEVDVGFLWGAPVLLSVQSSDRMRLVEVPLRPAEAKELARQLIAAAEKLR